ncbi:MAG: acyl carrier protein [Candidatus Omnitrophota bacterium]|nr:acyl carrier protein [Candidatus Omnitrophota bacterium]
MSLEDKVKEIFAKVLSIKPEEIKSDAKLYDTLGVDSTEMVEVAVALEKAFGIDLADNEIKKTHSLNEIIAILKSKGAT